MPRQEHSPTPDMMEKLNIDEKEMVLTFTRIRKADGKIAAYCVDTIPNYIFKDHVPQSLENISMFNHLVEKFNIHIECAVAEIIPSFPTAEMVEVLKVPMDKLFLLLHQIHYDKEEAPLFILLIILTLRFLNLK